MFDINTTCRTCGATCKNGIGFKESIGAQFKKEGVSRLFDLMSFIQLDLQEDDGLPQQICTHCYNTLIRIYLFRTTCENVQKELRANLSSMRNNDKKHEILPDAFVSIPIYRNDQLQENTNDEIIPVIKTEPVTEDCENSAEAQSSGKLEDTIASAVVKSEAISEDSEDEIPPTAKRLAISNECDSAMSVVKTEAFTADDDIATPKPRAVYSIKGSDSDDRQSSRFDKQCENNSTHQFLETDSSELESDEEIYNRKIANWKCEYYIEEDVSEKKIANWKCEYYIEEDVSEVEQNRATYSFCKERFISLSDHLKFCCKLTIETCKLCTLQFKTQAGLIKHWQQTHDGCILCTACTRTFKDFDSLLRHLPMHRVLYCGLCKKLFHTVNIFAKHIAKNHAKKINQKCPICDQMCSTEFQFNEHVRKNHSGNIRYQCQYCRKNFWELDRTLRYSEKEKHK